MFLDEKGEKISKSKGNGLSIEEWLTYATPESLALYMYREPRKAKQLHFGVIPKTVDEYYQFLGGYAGQPVEQKLGNPVLHIHGGRSEEHTSELQSLMRSSYAVFCLNKKKTNKT